MSIRIQARNAKGFRRCGLHHPATPVVFPDGYFDAEELDRLRAEPQLVVEVTVEGPSAEGGAPSSTEDHLAEGTASDADAQELAPGHADSPVAPAAQPEAGEVKGRKKKD